MKKTVFIFVILFLLTGIVFGCGKNGQKTEPTHTAVQFTDSEGNTVSVTEPKRVAVLSGSFAETWMLAGGTDTLKCITQDAIDERNLSLGNGVINAGSLKTPNTEIILNSDIDFAVLSANIQGQVKLGKTLEEAGITCAYFDVETFDDYLRMLKIFTDITGRKDLYEQNGTAIQDTIKSAVSKKEGHPAPSVLLIRAYSTGAKVKNSENNMTGAMLKELGCLNIADSDNALLEELSMEKIIEQDPDFIFVTTMGSDDKALTALADTLQKNPAWNGLSAVKSGKYIVLEKELFHYKPNNRWGESYEKLAQILYGE